MWSDNFDSWFPQSLVVFPVESNADLLLTVDAPLAFADSNWSYTLQSWLYYAQQLHTSTPAACYITDGGTNSTMWPASKQRSVATSTGYRNFAVVDLKRFARDSVSLSNRVCSDHSCSMSVIATLPNGVPIAFLPIYTSWYDAVSVPVPNWSGTSLSVVLILAFVLVLSIGTNIITMCRILSKQSEYVQLSR